MKYIPEHQLLQDDHVHQIKVSWIHDTFKELYVRGLAGATWAQKNSIELENQRGPLESDLGIERLASWSLTRAAEVYNGRLGLVKALNSGYYFPRFPLSLRRFAPTFDVQYLHVKYAGNKPAQDIFELAAGLEFELLFIHNLPLRLNLQLVQARSDFHDTGLMITLKNKTVHRGLINPDLSQTP